MSRTNFSLAFLLFFVSASIRAEDRYFLLMFGSQRPSKSPDHAHTFATFVKRSEGPLGIQLEVQTISWLPAKLRVRTLKLRPETGHNYELYETIRYMQRDGQRVSMWGPYEIKTDLYHRACRQAQRLATGTIRYKSYDGLFHSSRVTNCIHAVASIVEGDRVRIFGPNWGDGASYHVLKSMSPWIKDQCTTHDGIVHELGLEKFCIAYRKAFEKPMLPTVLPLLIRDRFPQPTQGPPRIRGRR